MDVTTKQTLGKVALNTPSPYISHLLSPPPLQGSSTAFCHEPYLKLVSGAGPETADDDVHASELTLRPAAAGTASLGDLVIHHPVLQERADRRLGIDFIRQRWG